MTPTEQKFDRDWAAYYQAVEGRPPRETLLAALDLFEQEPEPTRPRFAVDLGCGEGRDTVELLRRGWQVLAIDGETQALERLSQRPELDTAQLETRLMRFEALTLPSEVDLINASFCLPFCPPLEFPGLWEKMIQALKVGGRISCQLFGDRDSWASDPNMTHHSRAQLDELLQAFEVESFQEEEHPGKTAIGDEKYWHIFHLVICKK